MAGEDDLRARIEAMIASRRAGAARARNASPDREDEPDTAPEIAAPAADGFDVVAPVPRSLEPIRPWVAGDTSQFSLPHDAALDDPPASTDHGDGGPGLDPVRPWLLRPPPEPHDPGPADASFPEPAPLPLPPLPPAQEDGGPSRLLDPVRPWLHQRLNVEPQQPAETTDPGTLPPVPPASQRPEPRLLSARPPDGPDGHGPERRGWLNRHPSAEPDAEDETTIAEWLAPPSDDPGPPLVPVRTEPDPPQWQDILPPTVAGRAAESASAPGAGGDPADQLATATGHDPDTTEAEDGTDTHPGTLRRALTWLLEPAPGHESADAGTVPAVSEPTPQTFDPPPDPHQTQLLPRVPSEAPAEWTPTANGAARTWRSEPETAAAWAEPERATDDAAGREAIAPGTDLARRLAAANAAAADVTAVHPVDEQADSPLVTGATFAAEDERGATSGRGGRSGPRSSRRTLRAVKSLLIVGVVAVTAAVLLRTYVAAPYFIPSASMEPTLHGCQGCDNDHVLVNKLSYRMHAIHRGDVVVFHRPAGWKVADKTLIKRVIGLPGEVLTARKGVVYIGDSSLEEPYLDKACPGGTATFPTKPIKVPEDSVFVMGDNRCDSADSRRFGAIPESSVIGRAFVTIWPTGRLQWL